MFKTKPSKEWLARAAKLEGDADMSEEQLFLYKTPAGASIVCRNETHYSGIKGVYGVLKQWYEDGGLFSCGARYYFEKDFEELEYMGPYIPIPTLSSWKRTQECS